MICRIQESDGNDNLSDFIADVVSKEEHIFQKRNRASWKIPIHSTCFWDDE